jgi:hypothetical protein
VAVLANGDEQLGSRRLAGNRCGDVAKDEKEACAVVVDAAALDAA